MQRERLLQDQEFQKNRRKQQRQNSKTRAQLTSAYFIIFTLTSKGSCAHRSFQSKLRLYIEYEYQSYLEKYSTLKQNRKNPARNSVVRLYVARPKLEDVLLNQSQQRRPYPHQSEDHMTSSCHCEKYETREKLVGKGPGNEGAVDFWIQQPFASLLSEGHYFRGLNFYLRRNQSLSINHLRCKRQWYTLRLAIRWYCEGSHYTRAEMDPWQSGAWVTRIYYVSGVSC